MDNNQLKTTAKYAYILGVTSSIVALIKWLYLRYTLPAGVCPIDSSRNFMWIGIFFIIVYIIADTIYNFKIKNTT